MKPVFFLSVIILFSHCLFAQNNNSNKARELVGKMTLEEKVTLLSGIGMHMSGLNSADGPVVGQTMDKVPGAAGGTRSIPRLGLPNTIVADGPAGLRILPRRDKDTNTYYATAFPVGTLLASTWDTALVEEVGRAMGNELKEYGVDVLLGPGMNIHRNPLGGRNFEYYSEDPIIAGNIAAAMVKGIESNGVGTSIKHFAANNQETNRNLVNTIVSERALREIYLKGFEITVKKSQPWTVMSSYNKINGIYTSQSHDLLTTILREEWGFKGLVMTDWFGGKDPVAQMKAGNDLLMPGTPEQTKAILEAVKNGTLEEKVVNENATRVVTYILGSPAYKKFAFNNKPDLKAHARIARTAAAEGMILLKNDTQTLPFGKNIKRIAAFGNTSYDYISGGTGSGDVNEAYTVSLVEGLSNAGYTIEEDVKNAYSTYVADEKIKHPKKSFFEEFLHPTPAIAEMAVTNGLFNKKADEADIALITIGRNAGEGSDRKIENDYYLNDMEKQLIKTVSAAFHAKAKKVIVILNVGGVVDVNAWVNDADAILLAWQGGQESGNAVADVLSGSINPSGKLTSSFPAAYADIPSAKSFPGKNLSTEPVKGHGGMVLGYDSEVTYEEGIYVGYRYYNTFHVKTAYPFGYGLSYTQFTYDKLALSNTVFNKPITATVTVTNAGKIAGKEVVQLYISAPTNHLNKPEEELKGFAKTALLQPGQSEQVSFIIQAKDLSSFYTNKSSWIADAGTYTVKIGASSSDFRQTATFKLATETVTEKCHKVLVPQSPITELKK